MAMADHGGDLNAVASGLIDDLRSSGALSRREVDEAKLSHVTDLDHRLIGAGLTAGDLATAAVLAGVKVTRRAREKVVRSNHIGGRAQTPAMIDTPRRVLGHRARYGYWHGFPSDPGPFFERFRSTVQRKGDVPAGETFAIVERLERRLENLDGPRRTVADRLAPIGRSTPPDSNWPMPPMTATAPSGKFAPRAG